MELILFALIIALFKPARRSGRVYKRRGTRAFPYKDN